MESGKARWTMDDRSAWTMDAKDLSIVNGHIFFNLSDSVRFGKADPRAMRSIPLVLAARSIEKGRRVAGITRQTWHTRMKDDAFRQEVRPRRETIVSESLAPIGKRGSAKGVLFIRIKAQDV